ncbi:MAG: RNA polymerase sigma factor [Bacteroidales bacterium]
MAQRVHSRQKDSFLRELIVLQDQLYYFALQLTENREEARDLVQETNFKALNNRSKLHHHDHLRAWLYTILKNTHINYLRSSQNKQMVFNTEEVENTQNQNGSDQKNPEDLYMLKELHHLLNQLPENFGKPIHMHLAGFSYKEISDKMHIPIGTVKSRIHLGKKELKKVYLA